MEFQRKEMREMRIGQDSRTVKEMVSINIYKYISLLHLREIQYCP